MKKIIMHITIWYTSLLFSLPLCAQTVTPIEHTAVPLELSTGFTTHIIFPYSIKMVDLGSTDILAQKAEHTDNVLQVKAAKENFERSNLTVIAGDGTLYSFLANYVARPDRLTISLTPEINRKPKIKISDTDVNEATVLKNLQLIANQKNRHPMVKRAKNGAEIGVSQLYTHDNMLYIRLALQNSSKINYRINQIRFFMRDNKRVKRTTLQQQELLPIYVDGDITKIPGQSQQQATFVLPSFTIPDGKHLQIQMLEENGGRNIEIKLRNRHLLKAVTVE